MRAATTNTHQDHRGDVEEPVRDRVRLQTLDRRDRIALGVAEHVMPLQNLVQHDPAEQTPPRLKPVSRPERATACRPQYRRAGQRGSGQLYELLGVLCGRRHRCKGIRRLPRSQPLHCNRRRSAEAATESGHATGGPPPRVTADPTAASQALIQLRTGCVRDGCRAGTRTSHPAGRTHGAERWVARQPARA